MFDVSAEDLLFGLTIYGLVVAAAFWLAMIIWTYRDMRARSRDSVAQMLVAVMVAVLTVPGLLIYIFLRPRETLAEAYERSLEEEALLQDIEEKPTCPACGQRVQEAWQVCAYCHTRLKKPCISCGRTLELSWDLCPYCATSQVRREDVSSYVPPLRTAQNWAGDTAYDSQPVSQQTQTSEPLEYIDDDDYR